MTSRALLFAVGLALAGCGSDEGEAPAPVVIDRSPLGDDRPVEPFIPASYDGSPIPLVILLHGYGATGEVNDWIFGLSEVFEEERFILLRPDGTRNDDGRRFWNATDACCAFDADAPDDVAYLAGLIEEARARYDIARVAVVGHSNGGFMAHRFACDRAELVDAIGSLAGVTFADPAACQPSEPVAVLQMHGVDDDTVLYEGGEDLGGMPAVYPSAEETVATWAALDGCATSPSPGGAADYSDFAEGDETTVHQAPDCPVVLWEMAGVEHVPGLNQTWRDDLLRFLLDR